MMNLFLKAKHWQLFLLLVALPVVGSVLIPAMLLLLRDPSIPLNLFVGMMIVLSCAVFGWFYALGAGLHSRLPQDAKLSLSRFRFFAAVPFVYMVVLCVGMLFMFNMQRNNEMAYDPGPFIVLLIFPVHLFSIYCIFYQFYFIGKSLKSVELGRSAETSEFIGEFFLLWFYPVGVWIIQPRVNRIFSRSPGDDNLDGHAIPSSVFDAR